MRWIWLIIIVLMLLAAGTSGKETIPGPLYGMEFLEIPAGSFMMGCPPSPVIPKSLEEVIIYLTDKLDPEFNEWHKMEEEQHRDEKPQHRVDVDKFYVMTTEVTQRQWEKIMGTNPSRFKGKDLPVEGVSWDSVKAFVEKLNAMYPGREYRLPSEAEWEYACRANSTTRFCDGNKNSDLDRVGWFDGNSGKETHPCSAKSPNAWGVYDMHGNVWEWCEDRYSEDYENAPEDGSALVEGSDERRVVRGGASTSSDEECRGTSRRGMNHLYRSGLIGFRLVFSL
jgi:formylglycine-generating enzyme required for sulfatase activity